MGRYVGIPILTLAAILNATMMSELRIGGGAPDLVFLLVMSWALLADLREGLIWAVFGGVMQDLLSIAPLGTSALGLVLVVFAADTVFGAVGRRNLVAPLLVAVTGTLIYHLGVLLVLSITGTEVPFWEGLTYVTFPSVVYNLVLVLPVFRTVGAFHRALQPRRVQLD